MSNGSGGDKKPHTLGGGFGLADLPALLKKPEITGAWFNNKEIKLDGYNFISCRFDNCKLTITSTNFELNHCYLDEKTLILYGADVLRPIRLFTSRWDWMYKQMPYFAPTLNDDGTITISG